MRSFAGLSWRSLERPHLPALAQVAAQCLDADGGQPYAADPEFLSARYLAGAMSLAGFDDGRLAAVVSVRRAAPGSPAAALGAAALTTGLVHPSWRRRGIGGRAFDWAARQGNGAICAETEALGDGAHALYLSRGLSQVFAEDVMRFPGPAPPPAVRPPGGLRLDEWGKADPARFYAVYAAAFGDRPGFPGWPLARWVGWISDDEDFRADWTLLGTVGGEDVAFIAGAAGGWITQVGVVPAARGRGFGACLVAEAVRRMRSAGETTITLNVNVDNPRAAALYRRLGFAYSGRRARYAAPPDHQPRPHA